jgi:hypothetical protein
MSSVEVNDTIVTQGRVLQQAVEALGTVELDDTLARVVARLLQDAYRRRLEEIATMSPDWMNEPIPHKCELRSPGSTAAQSRAPMKA